MNNHDTHVMNVVDRSFQGDPGCADSLLLPGSQPNGFSPSYPVFAGDASSKLCLPGQPSVSSDGCPLLHVDLFGGFNVTREITPVDRTFLGRTKVQTLMSILVLSGDRDVNATAICHSMWPEAGADKANRSLYSLWGLLRNALVLSDKRCPYLERRNSSCRLVGKYVISDVQLADDLCNRLQFGCTSADEATLVARQLQSLYRGDLLPGEESNALILRKRWEWRSRVVESLAGCSRRLYKEGEVHHAIWLSRFATSVDPTREDACVDLMKCYLAVGAKAAAIQAYNELRHYLMVELAVTPSSYVVEFFNEVIADEEE